MLVLQLKTIPDEETRKKITAILQNYVVRWDFTERRSDFAVKITVYFAQPDAIVESLVEQNIEAYTEIVQDEPIFTREFDENLEIMSSLGFETTTESFNPESKFTINQISSAISIHNALDSTQSQQHTQQIQPLQIQPQQQTQAVNNVAAAIDPNIKTNEQMYKEIIDTQTQVLQQLAQIIPTLSNAFSQPATPTTAASTPGPSSSSIPIRQTLHVSKIGKIATAFAAKNELLANGLQCDKCNIKTKDETILSFLDKLRVHVILHFDVTNPTMRRFKCKGCPSVATNSIKDMENHLKRHKTTNHSLPDVRNAYQEDVMSVEYLKAMAKEAIECFPDVFDSTPANIADVKKCATPANALRDIFPHLQKEFCEKNNISVAKSAARKSLGPVPIVSLD